MNDIRPCVRSEYFEAGNVHINTKIMVKTIYRNWW